MNCLIISFEFSSKVYSMESPVNSGFFSRISRSGVRGGFSWGCEDAYSGCGETARTFTGLSFSVAEESERFLELVGG